MWLEESAPGVFDEKARLLRTIDVVTDVTEQEKDRAGYALK